MKRISATVAVLAMTVSAAFAGQSKSVAGDMITVTAKVEAIELQSRTLTLKKDDGTYTTVVVPASDRALPGAQGRRHGHRAVLRQHRVP